MIPRPVLALALLVACGPRPFTPQTVVDSVRVLSSRTETPYARPGEDVSVDLLVADGRANRTKPLTVGWLPLLCVNPAADLYFACFAQDGAVVGASGVADAGAGSGGAGLPAGFDLASLVGTDITDFLVKGERFSFTMPADAIVRHSSTEKDYGLVILFNIACAGRVRIAPIDPAAGQQQMPLECVDETGQKLGAEDYTVGFTRVYAYPDRRNANPTIAGVTYQGQPVDLTAGVTVPVCTTPTRTECDPLKFDVDSPAESQEEKTGEVLLDGTVPREQVYAQYYSDNGLFTQDARLLYDSATGLVPDRAADLLAPQSASTGRVWVVVKDDRGGTSWVQFPLRAE